MVIYCSCPSYSASHWYVFAADDEDDDPGGIAVRILVARYVAAEDQLRLPVGDLQVCCCSRSCIHHYGVHFLVPDTPPARGPPCQSARSENSFASASF